MKFIACCARKSDEGKPKRSSSTVRAACPFENYGLARKSMIMDIAGRISRKTYKLHKKHNTEWLVTDGEKIGVQAKHKDELGIVIQQFFTPSYQGAPKPDAHSPIVLDTRQMQNVVNFPLTSSNAFMLSKEQPKTRTYKKNNLQNLLNSEQVNVIDSKELMDRIQNFVSKVKSRHKICKSKETISSKLDGRKMTPQEVLRSSNRPKSKLNMLPNQKPDAELKTKKIFYKPEKTLLPLNEDVLHFYNNTKFVSSRQRVEAELMEIKNKIGHIEIDVQKRKTNTKKITKTKKNVQKAGKLNIKKNIDNESNVWKNAVNIKLDKMNKKLPVAHSKSKSSEDPDRTPRPDTINRKDFRNANRPKIRNTNVYIEKKSSGKIIDKHRKCDKKKKEIKDKGKQQAYIKNEKINKVKAINTDKTEENEVKLRLDKTQKKINILKKVEELKEKSKAKINKPIEKKTEMKDKSKKQQPDANGRKKRYRKKKKDWFSNQIIYDTDEEEQVFLLGTEDEELMNADIMETNGSIQDLTPKKIRATEKFKKLIMKMKAIIIKSGKIAKDINRIGKSKKARFMKTKEQQKMKELTLKPFDTMMLVNELIEDKAVTLVSRTADVGIETNNVKTVAIYEPNKEGPVVKAIMPRLADTDRTKMSTIQIPVSVQLFFHRFIEHNICQKLTNIDKNTSRETRLAKSVKFATIHPIPKFGARWEFELANSPKEPNAHHPSELEVRKKNWCSSIIRKLITFFQILVFILFVMVVFADRNPIYFRWLMRRVKYYYFDKKAIIFNKFSECLLFNK